MFEKACFRNAYFVLCLRAAVLRNRDCSWLSSLICSLFALEDTKPQLKSTQDEEKDFLILEKTPF